MQRDVELVFKILLNVLFLIAIFRLLFIFILLLKLPQAETNWTETKTASFLQLYVPYMDVAIAVNNSLKK